MLSWVNIRNNVRIEVMDWEPILKHSFNFSDIEACEEKKIRLEYLQWCIQTQKTQ